MKLMIIGGSAGGPTAASRARRLDEENVNVRVRSEVKSIMPDVKKIKVENLRKGVDKRFDALATAISAKMTVKDFGHLEMGYVPQYGSAKEVLNKGDDKNAKNIL